MTNNLLLSIFASIIFIASIVAKSEEENFYQDYESAGTDFWLTFLPNYNPNRHSSNEALKYGDSIYIYIIPSTPTVVTIQYYDIYGRKYLDTISIKDPEKVYVFKKPAIDFELHGFNDGSDEWSQNQNEVVSKMSFHVSSKNPINVLAYSGVRSSADAFLVTPSHSLWYEYMVLTFPSFGEAEVLSKRTPSQFAIVATRDSSVVKIKPSCPTYSFGLQEREILLNKGEVYLVQACITDDERNNDLTGTEIVSNKPIAVFVGQQFAAMNSDGLPGKEPPRSFVCQQLPPTIRWEREYIVIPFAQSSNFKSNDKIRILANTNGTTVKINNKLVATLNKGEVYETILDSVKYINSSSSVLVAAFKSPMYSEEGEFYGNPFMVFIKPWNYFAKEHRILSIQTYELDTITQQKKKVYDEHYVNIIIPVFAMGRIRVDGIYVPDSKFTYFPSTNFAMATLKLEEGLHLIESNERVAVYVYGYGKTNSYGYYGGFEYEANWTPRFSIIESYCFGALLDVTCRKDETIDSLVLHRYTGKGKLVYDSAYLPPGRRVRARLISENIYEDFEADVGVEGKLFAQNKVYNFIHRFNGYTFKYPDGVVDEYFPLQFKYYPGRRNVYRIPVYNYAKKGNYIGYNEKYILDVEIISPLNFSILTALPKMIYMESVDTLEFALDDKPSSNDTIFINLVPKFYNHHISLGSFFSTTARCYSGRFVAITFPKVECDDSEFSYINFRKAKNLNLVGDAFILDSVLRLTPSAENRAGAVWYIDPVKVANGFRTEFAFRIKNGRNSSNCNDNSLPGADGIAFVVQNSSPFAIGKTGGGIGYDGIANSVAVEFDTFSNDSTQIENFFDPNGNHVAVQSNGEFENSSKHTQATTIALNKDIIELENDKIYFVAVEYVAEEKVLKVYLDTTNLFRNLVIRVENFDLSKLIKLESDLRAWVGFTSATGCAIEDHDILYWHFCPSVSDTLLSADEENPEQLSLIYPNPTSDKIVVNTAQLHFPIRYRIYNSLGKECLVGDLERINTIDVSALPVGVYYIELISGGKVYFDVISIVK